MSTGHFWSTKSSAVPASPWRSSCADTRPATSTRAILTSTIWPAFSGWAKTVIESPRSVAQGFADYLNSLLNRTVTDARLTLLPIPGRETNYNLACVQNQERVAFALHGIGARLFVQQAIEVSGDHCRTVSYAYRFQTGEDKGSWVLRWEYFRERPRPEYEYPLAHVHANADFVEPNLAEGRLDKPPSHLHIPTARVPLELVLWHLIAEWHVTPKTDDWRAILAESLEGFEQRRTAP